MKNRSHRYDTNWPKSRYGHKYSKYKNLLVWWCLYVSSNSEATIEVVLMKMLSNTELEKAFLIKKRVLIVFKRQLVSINSCTFGILNKCNEFQSSSFANGSMICLFSPPNKV